MASSAPASTLIHSLQPRPPTPPRELRTNDIKPEASNRPSPLNPRHSLQTPPNVKSPAPGANDTHSNPSSARAGKRVGWSGQNQYYKDPSDSQTNGKLHKPSPHRSSTRPYKSSPLCSEVRPIKGILKPSSSPITLSPSFAGQLNGQAEQVNIIEMLDSTIKQLAGTDRDSKRDAYMALARALKASNNLPDRVALQNKMSLFMQFIQRDMITKDENNAVDSSLLNHALTLLATFLQFPGIASTITSEFSVFTIDYCIRAFDESSLSKDAIRHLMQVVALQSFPAKIMTLDRVGRLVSSLHKIENHYAGKGIVMKRLHIYKKLVSQSRNHMAVHSEWLKDVFTDMLSTIGDIQNQAINLGMEAGYSLRPGTQMLRKTLEILQTKNEELSYLEFYMSRLREMIKDRQRSTAVPRIWSVITLFLRCPLDRWEYYGPWFSLIQASFNSSDIGTKLEANYAWNRYSFSSLVDNGISQKLLLSLSQPLISQLRRKSNPKYPEDGVRFRKTVIGGICTLYYYAFRPGNDKKSPPQDLIWDHAVYPVLAQLLGLAGVPETHRAEDIWQASRILISLLNVSTPVVWREDRIMDLPPVKPEELPSIESKWIRRNSAKIFQVVGPILERKFTDLANKESLVYRLWTSLIGSIAAASAKDIKVSEDTVVFLAQMMGLLSKIWSQGCPPSEDRSSVSTFYSSVRIFVTSTVQTLGILPFMEKKLSMTVSNTFEPVATPSHHSSRSDKGLGVVRTSLHHLFSMLSSMPKGCADNDEFADFFQWTMEPFIASKTGRNALDLTEELLRLIPDTTLCPYAIWVVGAKVMRASLSTNVATGTLNNDKPLNSEFRKIASFLERGVALHPKLPHAQWLFLLEPFSDRVTRELGDAGRVLVITEPLAKVLLETLETTTPSSVPKKLEMVCSIVSAAKLPRDKQALGVAKRRLWGPIPAHKTSSADPFEHLPKLINHALQWCYADAELRKSATSQTVQLLTAISNFLTSSGSENMITQLAKLEKGVSPWVEDDKALLGSAPDSPLGDALRHLWSQICDEIASMGHLEKHQFDQLEGLLTAGFKSKHAFVVNKTAVVWNALAKVEEELQCSDSLKNTVSSLQSAIELIVPGTENSDGDFGAQTAVFIESQEAVMLSTGSSHDPEHQESIKRSFNSSLSKKRHLEPTSEQPLERSPNKRATRSKKTKTPPLRHDNSQIKFEPILDSSPRVEESQHLTERQKEIRERQKETAMAYSDINSTSPIQAVSALISNEEELQPPRDDVLPVNITPEKASSYQELISSTPTPRRGQFVPMETDNDPPSSPPEPRPYPLLSEIRSRSRANSSLDSWEFSSPPNSPMTSRQQVLHDADPPHITMTDESTQANAAALTRSRTARQPQTPTKTAASRPPGAKSQKYNVRDHASGTDIPKTPQRHATERGTSESPKSGDDEFVDAKAEIERSSPVPEVSQPDKDTSFALSEGDESHMMRFIVELESRRCDSPLLPDPSPLATPKTANECITVQAESESEVEASGQDVSKAMHAIIPSTPVEESMGNSATNKKKKRKREAKSIGGRRKKRKSVDKAQASQTEEGQSLASQEAVTATSGHDSAPDTPSGMRTRQSARKEQERRAVSQSQGQEDERDTDDEVMSQIIGESYAASQSQQESTQESELPSMVEDSVNMGSAREEAVGVKSVPEPEPEPELATRESALETENKADYILGSLRGGVDTLQDAALSRREVNKIEDALMDLKRALYAAEERGRKQQPSSRKLRQRRSKRLEG